MDAVEMISFSEVVRSLGIPAGFLEYHAGIGDIDRPQKWGNIRYYNRSQVDRIRAYFAGRPKGQHRPRPATRKEVE
jgi:hypothetical protein